MFCFYPSDIQTLDILLVMLQKYYVAVLDRVTMSHRPF